METNLNDSSDSSGNAAISSGTGSGGITVIPNPVVNGSAPPVLSPIPLPTPPTTTLVPPQGHGVATLDDNLTTQLVDQMLAAGSAVAQFADVISAADKSRVAKSRPGIEPQIPLVVTLAQRYNVNLDGYSLAQFNADVAFAARLTEISGPTAVVSEMLNDTILVTKGRYYSALTAIYSTLKAISAHDAALAFELQPLTTLFAIGKVSSKKRAKAGEAAASGSTTAAPAASSAASATGAPVEETAGRRKADREAHRA